MAREQTHVFSMQHHVTTVAIKTLQCKPLALLSNAILAADDPAKPFRQAA
jgi:hypothetical protein